jgi:hypothetical protein
MDRRASAWLARGEIFTYGAFPLKFLRAGRADNVRTSPVSAQARSKAAAGYRESA